MKFTRTLFASVFGLSALPLSLATPGKTNCATNEQNFSCNPFGPGICGSIYMTPELEGKSPLNLPGTIANTLFDGTEAFLAAAGGDPLSLIKLLITLPTAFASNHGTPTYKVTEEFKKEMELNMRNYVTTGLTTVQLDGLYDNISGKLLRWKTRAKNAYDEWVDEKDTPGTGDKWLSAKGEFAGLSGSYIDDYYKYAHRTPWENPQEVATGAKSGINGWGIYYSVYVTQMLIAFMQELAFRSTNTDVHNPTGVVEKNVVEFAWRGINHAKELVEMYLEQRESHIEGPFDNPNGPDHTHYYFIDDYWITRQSTPAETCHWGEANYISHLVNYPSTCPRGHTDRHCRAHSENEICPSNTDNFVKDYATKCVEGRKQFVSGAVVSNWNTWLIEPSKHWAALADKICEKTNDHRVMTMCLNQGEDNNNNYHDRGGTAVDYVSSNFLGSTVGEGSDFVLGTFNTDECPHGASHIIDRTRCETAYHSLAADYPNRVDVSGYSGWKGRWPHGCFLNRDNTTNTGVFFNINGGGNSAGTGQPVCETDKKYRIQQTCQRLFPRHKVVATRVSNGPSTNDCNDYYKSTQPGSTHKMNFYDGDSPTTGWTCCADREIGLYVIGSAGTTECPTGYSHINVPAQCSLAYQFLVTTNPEIGGDRTSNPMDWGNLYQTGCFTLSSKFGGGGDVFFNTAQSGTLGHDGQPICYRESSNQVNTATTSLVEASNDIPLNSHLPFSAMLGLLGLAMVATYKVVKDYRRHHHHPHHPHSKPYNKLDYESLMEA